MVSKKLIYNFSFLTWVLILSGCSSPAPLLLRSVDLMSPLVSDSPLSGQAGGVLNVTPTEIDLYSSEMTPQPTGKVSLRENGYFYSTGFLDLGLTVLPRFEIYSLDQGFGGKWQFLSSEMGQGYIAAIKYGTLKVNYHSYGSNAGISYDVKGSEAGVSLGYQFEKFIPYASYVSRTYNVLSSTSRGSRDDSGKHQTQAIGIVFSAPPNPESKIKFNYTFEITRTTCNWLLGEETIQYNLGGLYGITW